MDDDYFLDFLKYVFNISKDMVEKGQTVNVPENPGAALLCEGCGLSYYEFQKIGKLGCGQCYSAFRPQLTAGLKSIHGDFVHRGRIPQNGKYDSLLAKRELEEYRRRLRTAINMENYEEAAQLRDKIRLLERGGTDGWEN